MVQKRRNGSSQGMEHLVTEKGQTLVRIDRKATVCQIITVYNRDEKHLRMHNMLNLGVDGLQMQKTTSASTPVSQEQEYEFTVGTDSLKLD